MTHRTPSREELQLLGELSAGSPRKEEQVLKSMPDWDRLEHGRQMPSGSARFLKELHPLSIRDRAKLIESQAQLSAQILLSAIKITNDASMLGYLLTLFYDVFRDDTSIIDLLLKDLSRERNLAQPFLVLMDTRSIDTYVRDKVAFVISSLMAHGQANTFSERDVRDLVARVASQSTDMSKFGRLDCLKNLLKDNEYRLVVWDTKGVADLIVLGLDSPKGVAVYPAVFCSWLLTFNQKLLNPFANTGAVQKVCRILKETKIEKVVRICIHALLNTIQDEESVEIVIQQDAVHTLTLLEYEKWRDEELYQEIRDGLNALQQKIKLFSNFDRYCRELNTGVLTWSFLHSEKFWHENVSHFEEREYESVKKLVNLLRSNDLTTLAVACYDLGEFARLHRAGKKVLQKLKAKEAVIDLMSHKDRDVSREALLCTQKMMLERWQAVASTDAPSHPR